MKSSQLKKIIKNSLPVWALRILHQIKLIDDFYPPSGSINWGDLNRVKPLSTQFGYDRGGPVDRYYIERFLEQHKHLIKGNVLEIDNNAYTLRFGADKVKKSDVLHVVAGNPAATYVDDLSKGDSLPSDHFDCIVLTQTLHLIYRHTDALRTCHRILKKGGVLLLTVPGITPIDIGEWKEYWLWAFTERAVKKMFEETFPDSEVNTAAEGNVLAATAFLYGAGLNDVDAKKLDYRDPAFEVIITVKAIK